MEGERIDRHFISLPDLDLASVEVDATALKITNRVSTTEPEASRGVRYLFALGGIQNELKRKVRIWWDYKFARHFESCSNGW